MMPFIEKTIDYLDLARERAVLGYRVCANGVRCAKGGERREPEDGKDCFSRKHYS